MIIQHYSGLKPPKLEVTVGELWNQGYRLRQVVLELGEDKKNKIVWYWKKFHCMVGIGNLIPNRHLYGVKVNSDECSQNWLNHHGYTGQGELLKHILEEIDD